MTLKQRFNWVPFGVIALIVCAALLLWLRPLHENRALLPYAMRYGGFQHSEHGEEWLIRDFYDDRRKGIFVDVGANHYQRFNNTYYLDVALEWSGIAIDPQTQFAEGYAQRRPRTKFRPFFVSDISDQQAQLYVLKSNPLVSSADKGFTERWGQNAETVTAATITLNDLLKAEGIERFDFLNMDIETWEPKALAGFDIERFQPSLVCIEAHSEVIQEIMEYFTQHRYVLVSKYLRVDEHNLYFTPSAESRQRARGSDVLQEPAAHRQ